jgi:radical SAM superfamily enzyme YgiQ (UPF0313 family)
MDLVTFADLTHIGKVIDANQFPLAVGFVSALAKTELKDEIDVHLFKLPNEFASFLETNEPQVAAFSNYMWHENLNQEFAHRIKKHYPKVITIFGGPNFPTLPSEQKEFLQNHPEIDFYIDGEGEVPFLELYRELREIGFDAQALKTARTLIKNVCYMDRDEFINFGLRPRLKNIEEQIPSPFLMGLMDQYFTEQFSPLMETSRGCPFSCTFCHSGMDYESKVRRFSQDRITKELDYIAERVKVPSLLLSDLNWGSYKDDILTAKKIAELRKEKNWPSFVHHSTAKNQRDRMVEISSILGDALVIGATVQSTDPEVLKNIKRSNIAIEKSVDMAKASLRNGSNTFTEIILCLPGDTYEKHIKSVLTMLDSGMDDAAIYQFILLPGTEAGSNESRVDYEYETRHRVMPRCFGNYTLLGETFSVFEAHEVCVGNSTMSYEDYKRCRDFSLTVSIFNNGSIFEEVFGLAEALDVKKSKVLLRIHDLAVEKLSDIYDDFRADEARNFFNSREEIEAFTATPGRAEDYLNGEYGTNQIYSYRAIALIERIDEITGVVIDAVRAELKDASVCSDTIEMYLNELKEFIILRKSDPFDVARSSQLSSHFDFSEIEKKRFVVNPAEYKTSQAQFKVSHTKEKKNDLNKYFAQYGRTLEGLTYFLHRHPARMMYRVAFSDAL